MINPDLNLVKETLLKRKPARKSADVPAEVKLALSQGTIATLNLTEWHATDRQNLFSSVCCHLGFESKEIWTAELKRSSALKQSLAIGSWLSSRIQVGDESWRFLSTHESDIVREWAAIALGQTQGLTFARRLAWMKLFADDSHAGLREISWLALRFEVVKDPVSTIRSLVPWTGSRNERLRRFASEISRPCGVWCAHIPILKENPELGLPIVEPLRTDESLYVKKSVGNWLNDASKTQPKWVKKLAIRWLDESPTDDTRFIVKRALRTVGND